MGLRGFVIPVVGMGLRGRHVIRRLFAAATVILLTPYSKTHVGLSCPFS